LNGPYDFIDVHVIMDLFGLVLGETWATPDKVYAESFGLISLQTQNWPSNSPLQPVLPNVFARFHRRKPCCPSIRSRLRY
jgi:hypothetical protein